MYNKVTGRINPYENVYWFSRMLINKDKYGAVGKNSNILKQAPAALRQVLDHAGGLDDAQIVASAKQCFERVVDMQTARAHSLHQRIQLLYQDLFDKISTPADVEVLILTLEHVMLPIHLALQEVPNNDREFTVNVATEFLNSLGPKGLAKVVLMWDNVGVDGCLQAERTLVVREFSALRAFLAELPVQDSDIVLTAFVQEFERRLAQKRKQRAGGSLEDVASFLFDYYHIKAADKPEHFQADIEVDKWFRCKDRWLVGISCKRTLRERWKQVSSADSATLSQYKIRQIWHLVTYDEDLSDDKLALLGKQRHIFFLSDDSRVLEAARKNIGLCDYVRPMSSFIDEIHALQ